MKKVVIPKYLSYDFTKALKYIKGRKTNFSLQELDRAIYKISSCNYASNNIVNYLVSNKFVISETIVNENETLYNEKVKVRYYYNLEHNNEIIFD